MIFMLAALPHIHPATLLLAEVKTRGVGKEEPCHQSAEYAKPGDDVESFLRLGIRTHDGNDQRSNLPTGRRHTMCSRTNGGLGGQVTLALVLDNPCTQGWLRVDSPGKLQQRLKT